MTSDAIQWESDVVAALEVARSTRRFVLADFSREH